MDDKNIDKIRKDNSIIATALDEIGKELKQRKETRRMQKQQATKAKQKLKRG